MEPDQTPEVNEASGNSIFWALVALALNAMTDTSRIGIMFRPHSRPTLLTNSQPGFDPLRSSPVFCATETILDILFFFFGPKLQDTLSSTDATQTTTEHQPPPADQDPDEQPNPAPAATTHHPEPNTVNTSSSRATLKVVAFVLGVVPQAIKLFSMSGIVGTQICAAVFLAASVARALSYKSPSQFVATMDVIMNFEIYTIPRVLLFIFTYLGLVGVYVWLYWHVGAAAVRGDTAKLLFTLATFVKALYMTFALLTVLFNLVWRRSSPLAKWLPLIVAYFLPDTNISAHRESGAWIKPPSLWIRSLSAAISLIAFNLLVCLQVSVLCIATGRALSRLAAKRAEGFSDARLPTPSPGSDEPRSTGRFRVVDSLWQGMARVKAFFVGLGNALDNHGEWLATWYKGFGLSTDHIVLACGIFNLVSAMLYYLVVYDSTGTWSPSWTSVLG